MISFKANYICPAEIRKINQDNTKRTVKQDVSIIELNPKTISDIGVLEEIKNLWQSNWFDYCFAEDIYNDAVKESEQNNNSKSFFALTLQKFDFNFPDYKKILGLAEVDHIDKNVHKVSYLQTHPNHVYFVKNRGYKKIGKCLLKVIVDRFSGEITLNALDSVKNFYRQYGFKSLPDNVMILKR